MTRLGSKQIIRVREQKNSAFPLDPIEWERKMPPFQANRGGTRDSLIEMHRPARKGDTSLHEAGFWNRLTDRSPCARIWAGRDENQWEVAQEESLQSHPLSWQRCVSSIGSGGHIGKVAGPALPYYYSVWIQEQETGWGGGRQLEGKNREMG